jgi:hypothetical protein
MQALLVWIGGLLGIDVGMGFLVLAQRLATRFVLISGAVVAAYFAWNAVRTVVGTFGAQAASYMSSESTGSPLGALVFEWLYCLLPVSTGAAITTLFSAFASFMALNFYWQVLKMKAGGF